jgi:uncharacterized protein (DUF433 family)
MPSSRQSSINTVVHADPGRLGGVPVFRGTRVPVKALFDYLQAGKTVHQFLGDFDGVSHDAVQTVLRAAEEDVLKHVPAA